MRSYIKALVEVIVEWFMGVIPYSIAICVGLVAHATIRETGGTMTVPGMIALSILGIVVFKETYNTLYEERMSFLKSILSIFTQAFRQGFNPLLVLVVWYNVYLTLNVMSSDQQQLITQLMGEFKHVLTLTDISMVLATPTIIIYILSAMAGLGHRERRRWEKKSKKGYKRNKGTGGW